VKTSLVSTVRASLALLLLVSAGTGAWAQAEAGRDKARACAVCHGPLGIAVLPTAPNLAGQPASYLADQLKAYRSGKRVNEMMTLIAKPMSDEDIAALSAWYASIVVEARERP